MTPSEKPSSEEGEERCAKCGVAPLERYITRQPDGTAYHNAKILPGLVGGNPGARSCMGVVSRSAADVTKAGPPNPTSATNRESGARPAVNRSAAENAEPCEACELIYRAMDLDSSCEIPDIHDPTHMTINTALATVTKERDDARGEVERLTPGANNCAVCGHPCHGIEGARHPCSMVYGPLGYPGHEKPQVCGCPTFVTRCALASTASKPPATTIAEKKGGGT